MIPHRYLVIQIAAEDDEEPTPAPVTATEPVNKPPAKKQKAVPVPPFKGPRKCYFHGLEGFRCEGDDAAVRECFGKTGTASARNCKCGDKNTPLYFHHFCMVRYATRRRRRRSSRRTTSATTVRTARCPHLSAPGCCGTNQMPYCQRGGLAMKS